MRPSARRFALALVIAILPVLGACTNTETFDGCTGDSPGLCPTSCEPACPAGEVCRDGACVSDSSCDPACLAGEVCQDGACVSDPSCDPACEHGAICVSGSCVFDEDRDGVDDETDRCPGTPAGTTVEASGCPIVVPFSEGPYDVRVKGIAADFTVDTLDGPWSLRDHWTGDEHYLFVVYNPADKYATDLWGGDWVSLLRTAESNVHLFLVSARPSAADDVEAKRDAIYSKLKGIDVDTWKGRLHFVATAAEEISDDVSAFRRLAGGAAFAIDARQRWRQVGYLGNVGSGTIALQFLAKEAQGFDYEARIETERDSLGAREVPVFSGERHAGGWEAGYWSVRDVAFPSAEEMKAFDSMAVWMETTCPGHLQGKDAGCNEWDYLAHLFVCEDDSAESCTTELARYVTSYGREGEWLTDVSGLLPLFAEGGARKIAYAGANGYDMDVRILLWNAGKPMRPVRALPLWGGARAPIPFDDGYNDRFETIRFTVEDPGAVEAHLYTVITGHGFNATPDNCAEFCNHQHEFTLNTSSYTKEHAVAGTPLGCHDQVSDGVMPNQFGTWPYGRAGWCPGLDVKPWDTLVTQGLVSGENAISYRGLFGGKPYELNVSNPDGYKPEMRLVTWLIFYEAP